MVKKMPKEKENQVVADELVAGAISGDRQSEAELMSTYLPYVWRTVYLTCGGGPDVEDIVQNTMIQVLDKLPSYVGPGKFKSWLSRIAVNNVRQHHRKLSVRLRNLTRTDVDQVKTVSPLFEDDIDSKRLIDRLAHHLGRIEKEKRVAVTMSVIYGFSAREIGDMIGCSEEAAWKRIGRGRKKLMSIMERDPMFAHLKKERGQ